MQVPARTLCRLGLLAALLAVAACAGKATEEPVVADKPQPLDLASADEGADGETEGQTAEADRHFLPKGEAGAEAEGQAPAADSPSVVSKPRDSLRPLPEPTKAPRAMPAPQHGVAAQGARVPSAKARRHEESGGKYQVWYVAKRKARVHKEPKPEARQIGQLPVGEPAMVQVVGEWGRLRQGGFVLMSDLTAKPVPRNKGATRWGR